MVTLCQGQYVNEDATNNHKNKQKIILPVILFKSETGLALGASGRVFFLDMPNQYNQRFSTLSAAAMYTTKGQIRLGASSQLFLKGGDYQIDLKIRYRNLPSSFWGVGRNTPDIQEELYTMNSYQFEFSLQKRVEEFLYAGIEYIFHQYTVTEKDPAGLLVQETVTGNSQAQISGIGAMLTYDSRDTDIDPQYGTYARLAVRVFNDDFGNLTSFYKYMTDFRHYMRLGGKSLLAMQFKTEFTAGNPPFQQMAWYGGEENGRGYTYGRYIDRHLYLLQLEFRYRILPRWGIAVFGTGGEVNKEITSLFQHITPSAGAGIRFQIRKDNPTLLRTDFGIGARGNMGFYFGINQVF
ncbi:BamA/TamA family outer membrane protein [Limibacter armeniacum]|uniref:BamA/TamA family outer membrane protein n=1 Tax=Limibacter armeniacum TaxID=466084 RepID=UPI002FE5B809